jgi:hypothetical protein
VRVVPGMVVVVAHLSAPSSGCARRNLTASMMPVARLWAPRSPAQGAAAGALATRCARSAHGAALGLEKRSNLVCAALLPPDPMGRWACGRRGPTLMQSR